MGEDTMVELLEVLELYCELLLARFGLLETVRCVGVLLSCKILELMLEWSDRDVDPGVSEAVIGIVHAAPRSAIPSVMYQYPR
jgi:vacuolar protein sorting-associated protein IST1